MYILAIIGTLMLVESLGEIDKQKKCCRKKKTSCPLLDSWSSY